MTLISTFICSSCIGYCIFLMIGFFFDLVYKSINQTTRLTSGLQDLWYEKILCDVRIKSGWLSGRNKYNVNPLNAQVLVNLMRIV